MNEKKPSKREQRAIEGAERLRALGIHATADGFAIKTAVGTFETPQRDGALWHGTGGGRSSTLERGVKTTARATVSRAREAAKTLRDREAAALKEAAETKAAAERAEHRLAAAEDVLAKIAFVVGDAW